MNVFSPGFENYTATMDKMTNLRFGKELIEEIFEKAVRNIQENGKFWIQQLFYFLWAANPHAQSFTYLLLVIIDMTRKPTILRLFRNTILYGIVIIHIKIPSASPVFEPAYLESRGR